MEMYTINLFLILVMVLFFTGECSVIKKSENNQNSLLGEWEYVDCSIINTRVEGTLIFNIDSTFDFNGIIHEDYPALPFKGKYRYKLIDGKIEIQISNSERRPPLANYYFIQGDFLYFSPQKIDKIVQHDKPLLRANWAYKLKRIR